jgi:sec-independent protein translocase protein TatB
MFDIGGGEFIVIGIVALIAIGPKELPTVLRTVGRYMGKVKRMSAEFQGQFQDALREADMADLKQHAEDLKSSVADFANLDSLSEHTPVSTPEDGSTAETVAAAAAADMAGTAAADPTPLSAPPDLETPSIDVPLPEPLPPVTNADFAPAVPAVEPASAEPSPEEAPKRAGDAA